MRRLSLPKTLRRVIDAVEDGAIKLCAEDGTKDRYELAKDEKTLVVRHDR